MLASQQAAQVNVIIVASMPMLISRVFLLCNMYEGCKAGGVAIHLPTSKDQGPNFEKRAPPVEHFVRSILSALHNEDRCC